MHVEGQGEHFTANRGQCTLFGDWASVTSKVAGLWAEI